MILKTINFDGVTKIETKKHNQNLPEISDHLYIILIIGSYGSGKTNSLLNLINPQQDIDNFCLYVDDLNEAKFHF